MSPMLSLLKEMRGRLGMYLGVSSIIRLAAFLRGYELAAERFGGGHDPLLSAFRDWIQQRYQSSQRSWEETILLHSADEADAVKRFWQLLDEFLQERSQDTAVVDRERQSQTRSDPPTDKEWVEHWRRLGPILEAIRLRELREFNYEEQLPIIDALLQLGLDHAVPRPTSGLVELQRLLAKGRR